MLGYPHCNALSKLSLDGERKPVAQTEPCDQQQQELLHACPTNAAVSAPFCFRPDPVRLAGNHVVHLIDMLPLI